MIVKREEFIERVLNKLREKLEEVLPEEGFLFEMFEGFEKVLEQEVSNVRKG